MVVRSAAKWPVVFSLAFGNRQVVDARNTAAHQPGGVELPVLVAVGAKPVAAVVAPFIGEAHSDAVVVPGPDLLDQAIVELPCPFALEEANDVAASDNELGPIPPDAVLSVGERNPLRVAAVPGILCEPRLLRGCFGREGRQWRTAHLGSPGPFGWPDIVPNGTMSQ